jgi:type III restriction enzyme
VAKQYRLNPDEVDQAIRAWGAKTTDMEDSTVQKKAKAAIQWCERASDVSDKPWRYVLVPHDMVQINRTFESLI